MKWLVVLAVLCASTVARADDDLANFTIGPVIGVRIGGGQPGTSPLIVGIEGGAGYGPSG